MRATKDYKNTDYGLITPDGRFFKTVYEGHCGLAEDLFEAGILNESDKSYYGSVHVAGGEFDIITGSGWYSRQRSAEARRVTQKQFDTMVAYMAARQETFDFSILEIIDEKPKIDRAKKRANNPFSQVVTA